MCLIYYLYFIFAWFGQNILTFLKSFVLMLSEAILLNETGFLGHLSVPESSDRCDVLMTSVSWRMSNLGELERVFRGL